MGGLALPGLGSMRGSLRTPIRSGFPVDPHCHDRATDGERGRRGLRSGEPVGRRLVEQISLGLSARREALWVYASPALSLGGRPISRLPIACVALAAVLGVCAGCHRAGGDAADRPASAPAAQAIVQPGAPGQASAVISSVPAFHDNNFTDADVKFMQGMIHHHNQALLMVAMIPSHTTTVQLAELGRKIQISQTGEIQAMKDWLTDRHQEVPMIMPDGSAMMGQMDMATMPGMLTPEQMKALGAARGAAFDELFLTGMIQHHKGALAMVADLRGAGGAQEPNLADFTSRVDTDQRMEIVRMYGLLGRPVDKS
jgi:uncharacterized protein (DUF305 family)